MAEKGSLKETFEMMVATATVCAHCGRPLSAERIAKIEARVNPFDGSQNYCSIECHNKADEATEAKYQEDLKKRQEENEYGAWFSWTQRGQ